MGDAARRMLGLRPLEIATLVLLVFMWPLGAILLSVSTVWTTREKVIGGLLSLASSVGLPTLVLVGAAAVAGSGSAIALLAVPVFLVLAALPLIAVGYLVLHRAR